MFIFSFGIYNTNNVLNANQYTDNMSFNIEYSALITDTDGVTICHNKLFYIYYSKFKSNKYI